MSSSDSMMNGEPPHPFLTGLTSAAFGSRLEWMRTYVAKPLPEPIATFTDPLPATCHYGRVLIGNKYHAAAVQSLKKQGVTAVLNCASGGISRLPVDELEEAGIRYSFTNCRQDHYDYPILHDLKTGKVSEHLKVAAALYQEVVVQKHGKILFFCVAGQNRSAALAVGVLLLFGFSLDLLLPPLGKERPFILENIGFQKQLVELEYMIQNNPQSTRQRVLDHLLAAAAKSSSQQRALQNPVIPFLGPIKMVEIELLIPGLCSMEVKIPAECTVSAVKRILVDHANVHLLSFLDSSHSVDSQKTSVAKSWIVLAMFGYDDMYDIPLEEDAISLRIQIERMRTMFNLQVTRKTPVVLPGSSSAMTTSGSGSKVKKSSSAAALYDDDEWIVTWNERCRFALVIFSVHRTIIDPMTKEPMKIQEPWTFVHEERPGAPATFLENTLISTHLRAWDFVSGQAYTSRNPIVFCYAGRDESNIGRIDRRAFMKVSTSANEPQQYHEPGQILLKRGGGGGGDDADDDSVNGDDDRSGYILGMGENAIVHRVQLRPTSAAGNGDEDEMTAHLETNTEEEEENGISSMVLETTMQGGANGGIDDESHATKHRELETWDAAVKRPYTLEKMLASLNSSSSEAGLAKRLRFANMLNSDGRIVEFYGLGIAFACNAYNPTQYKYELVLMSKYERRFATRTLKRFMEDFIHRVDEENTSPATLKENARLLSLQSNFTLISVKVLLVSLLNAFRDLTLMGVRSFDFNHMNNVLVSRDFQSVRLVDIDGGCLSTGYTNSQPLSARGGGGSKNPPPFKPGLEVDLNFLLPDMVCQLLLGKGRGVSFVTNIRSEIWHAKEDDGKAILRRVMKENFYSHIFSEFGQSSEEYTTAENHLRNVAQWYYAVLKKMPPWNGWTNDIYDAMRCIDHMPIA